MTFHNQTFHNQTRRNQTRHNRTVPSQTARSRSCLMLAFGGLLVASLAMPALAQSVDIDADGNVRIDAGDGTVVQAGAAGTAVRTHGATVEASGQQNLSSRSGNYQTDGDNTQHTQVDVQGDGGVHVISAGGGRATSTVNGRTITSSSSSSSSSQRGGTTSYANQDLSGRDFAGGQLAGVTFANSHLAGASFRDAVLVEASFANANLDSVDFRGANLQDATLTNAVLSGARFDGATWVDGRICDSGSVGVCR